MWHNFLQTSHWLVFRLRPPHTSRFDLSASVWWIQTNLRQGRALSGDIWHAVLDLKTSCRTLSASVRWTKTICQARAYLNQWGIVIIVTQTSVFSNVHGGDRLGPNSSNAVSRDKKLASVRQHLGQKPCNCIEFTTFHHTKLYSFENLSLAFVKIASQFRKF